MYKQAPTWSNTRILSAFTYVAFLAGSIHGGFAVHRIVAILDMELLENLVEGKSQIWSILGLSASI